MFKITVATVTANNLHHKNTFENLSHNRFGKDTTFGAPSYSVKEKRKKITAGTVADPLQS